LQRELPRAVLIDSANSTPSGPGGVNSGASLGLTMKVFVAKAEVTFIVQGSLLVIATAFVVAAGFAAIGAVLAVAWRRTMIPAAA